MGEEEVSDQDAFVRVPLDYIPKIVEALKSDLPDSLVWIQSLQKYHKCSQVVPERDIRLYTPGGVVDQYGTFLLFIPDHRYGFQFHTRHSDQKRLKKMILGLKDLNWNKTPMLGPVHDRFYAMVHDMMHTEGFVELPPVNPADNLAIDRDVALNLDTRPPEGYEVRPITVNHAEFINNRWPHRTEHSIKFIEDTIKTGGGYGIVNKETDEMVSWGLHSLVGGVGMIQTAVEYRHKGFGSLVGRVITKHIAETGGTPQLQISRGIPFSKQMFEAMGYKVTHLTHWICFGWVTKQN